MSQALVQADDGSASRAVWPAAPETAAVVRHLAHEIRQPLSTIESIAYYLELVLPADEQKARAQVAKLQQLVRQANGLLTDTIHCLQAAPSRPELLDLNRVLSWRIADSGIDAHLRIKRHFGADVPAISFDPAQMHHLLGNLFAYVRSVASCCQPLIIETAAAGDRALLRFRFFAPGLRAEDLQALFEAADPSLLTGTALMMACVGRIVQAQRARINVLALPADELSIAIDLPIVH